MLDPGNAAYSDLAPGPDGSIFCLYERGGPGNQQYRSLTLARFSLDWVRDHR